MNLSEDDPRRIGPWEVESVHFREPGRRSYAARIKSLSADILLVDVATDSRAALRANLQRAKGVFSLEIPRVLDSSLDTSPQWVASDPVSGQRLADVLQDRSALSPHQWAELAKTALIGCAALRAQDIKAFQLSGNTFVIDRNDVHMVDMWAGMFVPSAMYPEEKSRLNELSPQDDKYAIGKILTFAMGIDPGAEAISVDQVMSAGYTQAHMDFISRLTSDRAEERPSTERALRMIPGGDPGWTVPVFALDKPGRQRAKQKAQRGLIVGAVGILGVALIVGAIAFLGSRSNGPASGTQANDAGTNSEISEPIVEARLSYVNQDAPPEVFTDADFYSFSWCFPDDNLRMDEIPSRLVLQELDQDEWKTDSDVIVRIVPLVKCGDGLSAVSFTAPLPDVTPTSEEWTPCKDYRVLVPRLSSERRAPIRFCLQQRVTNKPS